MVLAPQPLAGLAPEKQPDGDRSEGGGGDPQRHHQPRQEARTVRRLGGEGLGVQHDALARPVADEPVEALQQARDLVGRFEQRVDPLFAAAPPARGCRASTPR